MLLLLFLLSVSSDSCRSQFVYNGPYALRRPPPARRSAIEALERLRMPLQRYFPQVDSEVASAPQAYALPPPYWTEELARPLDEEYGTYEYEAPSAYAEELYPQDPEYNDLVESYLMRLPEQPQVFENVQRRSGEPNYTTTSQPSTQQVQMTAVPASPEKKNVKSLIVPDPIPETEAQWRESGQKEEPLFRPLQNSQRSTWAPPSGTTQLKSPIPLLKKMIQSGREVKKTEDPLMEELSNLKKEQQTL